MIVSARHANHADVDALGEMYRALEKEMVALHPMWPLADGLAEPIKDAFVHAIDDDGAFVLLGEIDGYPLGFMFARVEGLLPQANGELVGSIRIVYVDIEAREVGVGEVMRDTLLDELRARGISKFDAHVLPGHRLAKNFFESGGFSARSIVMHHDDNR